VVCWDEGGSPLKSENERLGGIGPEVLGFIIAEGCLEPAYCFSVVAPI
jgi:hypothetical protein